MTTVAVRDLKNRLSAYLRKIKSGEQLVVTEPGKPIAIIKPTEGLVDMRLDGMIREQAARWQGGKPHGSKKPAKIKGPSVAKAIIEDRR